MYAAAKKFSAEEATYPQSATIETTLFELIEAISEEVLPGEDRLVAAIVAHMLDTGKIKFMGGLKGRKVEII